jgi:hypothetical protein
VLYHNFAEIAKLIPVNSATRATAASGPSLSHLQLPGFTPTAGFTKTTRFEKVAAMFSRWLSSVPPFQWRPPRDPGL